MRKAPKSAGVTVADLIKMLQREKNQDRIVVMAKDSEGNAYSPFYSFWAGRYRAETTWYGYVGMESIEYVDRQRGYTDDVMTDGVPALIFCPVN